MQTQNNQSRLERILSGIGKTGKALKDAGKFVKDVYILAKENPRALVLLGSLMAENIAYGVGEASPGYLTIKNNLNSKQRNVNIIRDDGHFFGARDDKDNYDIPANSQPSDYPNCYSDIPDYHLWSNYTFEDSNAPYDIKFSFNGTLSPSQPNWLEFYFSYGEDWAFSNKPITFQSERLPYGEVVDVRKAISQNSGRVDFINVPAGTYNQWVPYGSGDLEIGTRFLADLNDDGIVNNLDFVILADDWQKPQGKYIGDISGPNGIPDGYVNVYDLSAFANDYLKDIEDPNTW